MNEPSAPPPDGAAVTAQCASWSWMWQHPAHVISLATGAGLSRWAPGTMGTLWAAAVWWAVAGHLSDFWIWQVLIWGWPLGVWASRVTARSLSNCDPSCVVWDEVMGFWWVLWVAQPQGWWQWLLAFGLFRLWDATKWGPVGWADRYFKPLPGERPGWRAAIGIMLDDAVAAACTLLCMALLLRW